MSERELTRVALAALVQDIEARCQPHDAALRRALARTLDL